MVAFVVVAAGGVAGATSASAGVLDSYCSPSGDYCTAVAKRDGRIKLEVRTFSFQEYLVCVTGPAGTDCLQARADSDGRGLYSDRIDAERRFPQGTGRYTARWKVSGSFLGPKLHFRIRRETMSARGTCPGIEDDLPRRRISPFANVAFPRLVRPGHDLGDAVYPYPGRRLYAKIPLFVRGRASVTVSVAEPARISWGRDGEQTDVTIVRGARCAHAGWHGFPGGFIVPRPGQCVELQVTTRERTKTVPFGVGAEC